MKAYSSAVAICFRHLHRVRLTQRYELARITMMNPPPPHLPDLIKTSVTLRTSAFHCSVRLRERVCASACEHNSITGFIMQHVMANEARDITTSHSERSLFQQPRQALVVYLWSRSWHHQRICRTDCIPSSYNLLLRRPGFIRVKIIMTRNIRKFVPSVNKMPQRSSFTTNYSWCNLSYLSAWGGRSWQLATRRDT